jgi:hypothetical protein
MHQWGLRSGYGDGDTVHSLYLPSYGFPLRMTVIEIQIEPQVLPAYMLSKPGFVPRFESCRFRHPRFITRRTKDLVMYEKDLMLPFSL